MTELTKKRVLLIALHGYAKGIKEKMEQMGIKVDYFNDKPNDGVICKALGRLKVRWYQKVIEKYYKSIISSVAGNQYDFILVIRGEYTPLETLHLLKDTFPKAKRILYMWDSIQNNKGIEEKWNDYHVVYTFDRIDYLAHKDKLKFLPLYYYEDYLPKTESEETKKYDIAFIGTGHEDRVKIVNEVGKQCESMNLKYFQYLFLPHKFIYFYNKVTNKNFSTVKKGQIHYKMLPLKQAYEIYGQASCIMDVESATQHGLTMRTIEMIGLHKKMITTNKDIVHYDFYHPNNIMVVNRENFQIDREFFKSPYVKLPEKIYQKYCLENWISQVLEGEE